MNDGIWKDIPGYEGLYKVSDQGRVKSLANSSIGKNGTRRSKKEVILRWRTGTGYALVALWKKHCREDIAVHVLVLIAFVGPKPEGMECCRHLNGNPLDNRPENLCWGTTQENMEDRIKHGRGPKQTCKKGEDISWSKFTEEDIRTIRRLYDTGEKSQGQLAKIYGGYQSYISRIVRKIVWSHVE